MFFSQTMVGVDGKPMSLSSIDEAATERMSSDEHAAWEKMQTQIYLGHFVSKAARFPISSIPDSKRQKI